MGQFNPLTKSLRPHVIVSWDAEQSHRKGKTMSEVTHIGNSVVLVGNDEFAHAYQIGYLTYKLDDSTKTFSDTDIYNLFFRVMTGVQHPGRYNAGYLAGWVAGLLEGGKKPAVGVATLVLAPAEKVQA